MFARRATPNKAATRPSFGIWRREQTGDEAEIEASRAPLIDHLIELRDRPEVGSRRFFLCAS